MSARARMPGTWRLALALLLFSLPAYACAMAARVESTRPAGIEATSAVSPAPVETLVPTQPRPAVPEQRLMTLEWPKIMRQDDSEMIRLSLEVDEGGRLTPTAVLGPGHEMRAEPVQIPNVFLTHNVVAEARLDLAGMQTQPAGTISEPLRPGSTVTFYWSIRAPDPGLYRGTVWLYLRFVPLQAGQPEEQIPITAQLITLEVVNFLGLSGGAVRTAGGIGAVLGFALSVDGMMPWVWKRLRAARPGRRPDPPSTPLR